MEKQKMDVLNNKISVFWSIGKSRTKFTKSRSFLIWVRDFPHFFEFADTALYPSI